MLQDRESLSNLKQQFLELLDGNHPEQTYQAFLEQHTQLIPREFVQNHGVHFDLVFRKLHLANDYAPDFFYMSKSSADWHLVLVEIEKPHSKYFKPSSNDIHPDFLAGLEQINRWRAWFQTGANQEGFINGTLRDVRTPMGYNKCHIKYVLVHGRRSEFEGNNNRRSLIATREQEDFKILSFDSLVESLHTKYPLYVCARKNEYLDVLSTKFVSDQVFTFLDPSLVRISDDLRADVLASKRHWQVNSIKGGYELDHKLDLVGRR
ncbi:DUF4263 domain-containing protein [Pseudomonas sp. v388]|uniref:Shedu anti-phage system protein SduA domain-containing protein n=1 Tax=Pseudomonas sp. v388 TaxID=2479849 RepID=UPI000F780AE7|nr:Shedu anti-phage system protein SduA domain-containing protein [Pseudomonas sp. v388]RRV10527.1 DUF4263 domain-containing protein [Pseudomonas sp. v388]